MTRKMSNRKNRLASYYIVCDENLFVQFSIDFHSCFRSSEQTISSNKRNPEPSRVKAMLISQNRMVDGIVPSASIQSACVGKERFGFQTKQLFDQSLNAWRRYVRIVGCLAYMNFNRGKVIFLKAIREAPCLE